MRQGHICWLLSLHSVGLQVAFDDFPCNSSKTIGQRREYWEKSRRLQHGTLVALWWNSPAAPAQTGLPATSPCITFATIAARDEQQLALKRLVKGPRLASGARMMGGPCLLNPLFWPATAAFPASLVSGSQRSLLGHDLSRRALLWEASLAIMQQVWCSL